MRIWKKIVIGIVLLFALFWGLLYFIVGNYDGDLINEVSNKTKIKNIVYVNKSNYHYVVLTKDKVYVFGTNCANNIWSPAVLTIELDVIKLSAIGSYLEDVYVLFCSIIISFTTILFVEFSTRLKDKTYTPAGRVEIS